MPVEMGLWRVDGDAPKRVGLSMLPQEKQLEDLLAADPTLLGERLLIFGRQVPTKQGKFIDLLGMDADGTVHVLELKRDKTPRDVVAQVLDYSQWVSTLDREDILEIARLHLGKDLAEGYSEVFGGDSLPEDLNVEQRPLIVASQLDDSSERIVNYLRSFGVPINAVFFAHLEDEGRRYVARSWLVEEDPSVPRTVKSGKTRAPWNGVDWYVAFGEENGSRLWEDARKYGFVSAGGGVFYTRTIRKLAPGARVNVLVPKHGYVGVGTVTSLPQRVDRATVEVDGHVHPLLDVAIGSYKYPGDEDDDDLAEWMVPVEWSDTVPVSDAFWRQGMFANQNSACPLRDEFTLEQLREHFPSGDELGGKALP
ncbi:MAG TPA: DUF91 domain-containing protein [Candidatus Luteococcus avicola]|nr:DUF91 domain-containing protein [Candidatus Luteococcus avicola]